jgi:hypothetical protein
MPAARRILLCGESRSLRSERPASVRMHALQRSPALRGERPLLRQRRLRPGVRLRRVPRRRCVLLLRPRGEHVAWRSQRLLPGGCERPVPPDEQRSQRPLLQLRLPPERVRPVRAPARQRGVSAVRDTRGATRRSRGTLLREDLPRSRGPPHLPGSPLPPPAHRSCQCENP